MNTNSAPVAASKRVAVVRDAPLGNNRGAGGTLRCGDDDSAEQSGGIEGLLQLQCVVGGAGFGEMAARRFAWRILAI
jgi:hypothetical protein